MNDPKIFIFANGNLRDLDFVKSMISPGDLIIAADGGGMHLAAAGLIPDVVIGDMDSIAPGVLAKFENSGSQILRYPVEKDETDLELAMELALQKGWKKMGDCRWFGRANGPDPG